MGNEISDLRLFAHMAEAGSLSATARRLNSSLPAMSRRLAAIEDRLGVRLIDRGTRRFALTAEGALLYERGLALLGDLDQLEAEVGARVRALRGHIRVGAPFEIGRRQIAPLIGAFCTMHPEVTVELALDDTRVDVVGNGLDLAIHVDEPGDGDVVTRLIWRSHRIVCASPTYLQRHGAPQKPADLMRHACICLVRGHQIYDRWTFEEEGQPTEVRVSGRLSSTNAEIVHAWTLDGLGIGLKALWDVEEDLATGRLVELLATYRGNRINLCVIYPTRRHLPNRVRVFIDFICGALTGAN